MILQCLETYSFVFLHEIETYTFTENITKIFCSERTRLSWKIFVIKWKFKKIICNILRSLVNSNRLKIIEFKCHLKYNSYLHFEPVTPASAHTVLAYLKFNRNFYNAKAIILDVKNDEMLGCDGQVERKIKCTEIVHPNNNSCVYSDVEGQLNWDRVGKNETLVPMI